MVSIAHALRSLLSKRRRTPRKGKPPQEATTQAAPPSGFAPTANPLEAGDTLAHAPLQAARLLSTEERLAQHMLRQALADPPGEQVWQLYAHVPVTRLVSGLSQSAGASNKARKDWVRRAHLLSVDFVVCDASTQVLAAVLLESGPDAAHNPRQAQRLQRTERVLMAAGVHVLRWRADWRPSALALRDALGLGQDTSLEDLPG